MTAISLNQVLLQLMMIRRSAYILFLFTAQICLPLQGQSAIQEVVYERVPDKGIQPQLLTDHTGTTHLIYFNRTTHEGRNRSGDLYYRQRLDGNKWSQAVKVSDKSFNHMGPVGKASAYIDDQQRVHVVWFLPDGGYLYSRSNLARTAFEPGRAIVTEFTDGLDAEASLTGVDNLITISWHAGSLMNEAARAVYSVTSENYGINFGASQLTSDPTLGACACCTLDSQYDNQKNLQIAYRSAINNVGRHMQVNYQALQSQTRTTKSVGEWTINACPVSSNQLHKDWLVFETQGNLFQINFLVDDVATALPARDIRQKHPVIATNTDGLRLIAWLEADGYFKGGTMALRVFDANNQPVEVTAIPAEANVDDFSVVGATGLSDNRFLVLY
tara:strand:- start:19994 stop:21154 length:1161 start_codon:yes stop_codon:yes gene_type:complete